MKRSRGVAVSLGSTALRYTFSIISGTERMVVGRTRARAFIRIEGVGAFSM